MSPVEILRRKIVLKEQHISLLREDIALLNKQVAEEENKETTHGDQIFFEKQ